MKKFLTVCLLLFVINYSNYCKAQTNASDSLALVQFAYNNGNYLYFHDNLNWLNGPVSEWGGVSVGGNGRVYALDLSNNFIYGGIDDLMGLTGLVSLNLSNNNFAGSLPSSISNLTGLQSLDLSGNNIEGKIPDEIGNLSNLEYLNLGGNSFTSLPSTIGNLTRLSSFEFANNYDVNSPEILPITIPASFANLTNLGYLDMQGSGITGSFPAGFTNLNISYLDLSYSTIASLPTTIGNMKKLQTLKMIYCAMGSRIPPSIGECSNLKDLELDHNNLIDSIPYSIGNLTNLTKLTLNNNLLDFAVPASIANLSKLTALNLGNNNLTVLPNNLNSFTSYKNIYFNNNKFTGTIPFADIAGLPNLVSLDLSYNQFTGGIPVSIENLGNLESLILSFNKLNGLLPTAYSSKLKYFLVNNNQLTGSVPPAIYNGTFVTVNVANNYFNFDGIEQLVQVGFNKTYAPQSAPLTIHYDDKYYRLSVYAGGIVDNNIYKWYRAGVLAKIIYGDSTFIPEASGAYSVLVTNLIATGITLSSGGAASVPYIPASVCGVQDQLISDIIGSTYQWQVDTAIYQQNYVYKNISDNSNYSGTNTNTLTFHNIPTSWYGYSFRCLVDGNQYSTSRILRLTNSWTGNADGSSWENVGNWSCGSLPDGNTDVVITSGNILINSDVTVRSLSVSPGVHVTVVAGYTLTITH